MRARRELVIASELCRVAAVGHSVRGLCHEHGICDEEAIEIELAIVEGVNNAIEHAYALAAGHSVAISLEIDDGLVVSRIRDRGRAMPVGVLEAVPDQIDPLLLPERGMGLFLIKHTMDEVSYETSGAENVLTLRRRCRGPS